MWEPTIPRIRPLFRAILTQLERDISAGRLVSGEQLPTHRDLARRLGVTTGTVTRAYNEAERLGLLVSRVGRGSFVLAFPEGGGGAPPETPSLIDLSINTITVEPFNTALNRVLGALSRRKSLHNLLEFQAVPGHPRHRTAGAKWLRLRGIEARPENVILCNGAQEGLMAVLATVTGPGRVVLTESLNYAGIKRLADLFRLDIRGVGTDAHGLRPDLLADAARGARVGAILCSPTLHNPTNALMPLERRREILRIAAALDAPVIENDSYGHLSGDETPTMAALDPARCVYVCGTSKSIAPGLRIGFMVAPPVLHDRLCDAIHGTSWTSPSLLGEIATALIEDGIAAKFLGWHQREAAARLVMARSILPGPAPSERPSYHLWMPMPAPWRSAEFVAEAALRGVVLSPAELFAVDRGPVPHAVRISLGAVREREPLRRGLAVVADLLRSRGKHGEGQQAFRDNIHVAGIDCI